MQIRLTPMWGFVAIHLLVLCVAFSALAQEKNRPQEKTRRLISDGYPNWQVWLDQDVRWIITPHERAIFLSLSKDEDRDHFVDDFWSHRDREENYRRIGYANEHFGVLLNARSRAAVPGWLTDRGRIYIAYGPPDSIRETGGDTRTAPAILWHYPSLPAYGKDIELRFLDVCNCGDYRLTTFPKNL